MNLRVRGSHARVFSSIFEEAQYQSPMSEFMELRTWVVTRLLWNPELDADTLAQEFINDYYGKAAPKIWEYYLLCQNLVKPDTHFNIYIKEDNPLYTDAFIDRSEALLSEALEQSDSRELTTRIQKVRMQILYLKAMRNRPVSLTDGTWDEFKKLMIHYDAKPAEWCSVEEFIEKIEKSDQSGQPESDRHPAGHLDILERQFRQHFHFVC